jgi:hypothetical protein
MRPFGGRLARRRLAGLGGSALLAVVMALAVFEAGQLLHLHRGTSPGLYNEDHVLAALDSLAGDAPLPDEPPAALVDLPGTDGPLVAHVWLSRPAGRHSGSRAPPLA